MTLRDESLENVKLAKNKIIAYFALLEGIKFDIY